MSSQLAKALVLRGSSRVEMPRLIYGTAWKKERTADLVYQALRAGFRGIDTAAQPRHYKEDLVGEGIRRAVAEGIVTRESLFIQTKFTSVNGQDPESIPYNPSLPIEAQVHASIASSLKNLSTPDVESPYLDSVVLHSPYIDDADTLTAWRALMTYVPHTIRHLGISNTTLDVVVLLDKKKKDGASTLAVVQNRFHEPTGYESELRAYCRRTGVAFQSFWTLSANPGLLHSGAVATLVKNVPGLNAVGALYCLVLGLEGTTILDGTTSELHMKEDLEAVEKVGEWAASEEGKKLWEGALQEFKDLIDEVDE